MKILFMIASLNAGGAERVLTILANNLCDKHNVSIVTFSKEDAFYVLDKRIKHIKLDLLKSSNSISEYLKNNLNRLFVLKQHMEEIDPDISISFMTQTNILAILASKALGKKIIVAERTIYNFHGSQAVRLMRRVVYLFSNHLIVQTRADSRHYKFIKNTDIIPNPIFMDSIKRTKENIVLAVGRLDENKNFNLLIKIFATLKTRGWKLVIAGDGPQKESLLALINSLGIMNIELIGKRKDIFEWYAKSSIFVLSSKKEGFPNVLLEAMGSGCAVVSFDCPYGPSEIIEDGKNGLLVENQNGKKLAEAIQKLMDNKTLRDVLSQEAVQAKEEYAIEKIAGQWEAIMEKVVSS